MIGVREKTSDSWLDPRCSAIVGWKYGKRLWQRCEGHEGLFLTLTYRRDDYEGPQDLWRKASDEQHVALFLRKIARHLGQSLKGKWFCKLEFQRGGWVHWHIIILDVPRVAHEILKHAWGKGHVWVRRLKKRQVFYCCKYVTKDASLPAWLLLERPRSVKVVRVSPGFWGDTQNRKGSEPDPDYEKWGPAKPQTIDGYVPLAVKIAKPRETVVNVRGRRWTLKLSMAETCQQLLGAGCQPVGRNDGWLYYRATTKQVEALAAYAADPPPRGGGDRTPRLYLRGTGNRDANGFPPHVDNWFREEASYEAQLYPAN